MLRIARCVFMMAAAALCQAQGWEVGGRGGYGFASEIGVSNSGREAQTGLANGVAAGVFLGQEVREYVAGEISYTFRKAPLRLSSGSVKTTFAGHTHSVQYDVVLYARPRNASARPFFTFGAGVRVFSGTQWESVYQPLQEFALLTKTSQVKPLISLGAGIRKRCGRFFFRAEVRDYVSPFPSEVIAPALKSHFTGNWLHDIVPLAGFGVAF
jgi:hypothetical protein